MVTSAGFNKSASHVWADQNSETTAKPQIHLILIVMTFEICFMLLLLVGTLVAFSMEKLPTELVAMIAFSVLLTFGLLPTDLAMQSFSNPGPIAIGALFIISAALERAGAIDAVAQWTQRLPKLSMFQLMPLLILIVAIISGFINNTPVVVVFLPIVIGLARQMNITPSKLLIPLSYASIFGGTCTLIGTSTNIIVSSVAENAGLAPFSMFELAAVGLPLLVIGILYLTLLGPKLLPERETISSILSEEERREYIAEAFVTPNSPLAGKTVNDFLKKQIGKFRILEVLRSGIKVKGRIGEIILKEGDRLLLAMSPKAISSADNTTGIHLTGTPGDGLTQINRSKGLLVEGVIGPASTLVGQSIDGSNFRQRFRLIPLAVHRKGQNLSGDFTRIPLKFGDTLLMLGTHEALDSLLGSEDILLLNKPPVPLKGRRKQLGFTLAVVALVILVATLGFMPIAPAAIIAAVLLITCKCITPQQAYGSIHWPILFLIFAMLGFGSAMEYTGTSQWLADGLVSIISSVPTAWQPIALLAGIYLITTSLTEVLSNNAAAILLASLAISIAETMGISARPLLVAIAVAASASFATPIGYQTNTYVYGVGGYKFLDFIRVGLPLNLIAFVIAVVVIPLVWEF